jgi:hypothetical protein
MKKIAGLTLFFSISFILFFVFSALFRFLGLWIEALRTMPITHDFSRDFFSAITWAVPFTLYMSVLFGHNYAAYKKIPLFFSIISIIVLSGFFSLAFSLGIQQVKGMNFAIELAPAVHEPPGLILSRSDTATIILKENDIEGPRVVSFPDQELHYQSEAWAQRSVAFVPVVPFGDETPWFIHSIYIDFNLSAMQFETRLNEGFFFFFIYGVGLILLLGSLRFLLDLSAWPLANLFLGALVFRGFLSLETFLNSTETQLLVSSFFKDRLPAGLITPLIFSCIGGFIIFYTFLSYFAWGKRKSDV